MFAGGSWVPTIYQASILLFKCVYASLYESLKLKKIQQNSHLDALLFVPNLVVLIFDDIIVDKVVSDVVGLHFL